MKVSCLGKLHSLSVVHEYGNAIDLCCSFIVLMSEALDDGEPSADIPTLGLVKYFMIELGKHVQDGSCTLLVHHVTHTRFAMPQKLLFRLTLLNFSLRMRQKCKT